MGLTKFYLIHSVYQLLKFENTPTNALYNNIEFLQLTL